MFYNCVLCGEKKEIRNTSNRRSKYARYRASEKEIQASSLIRLVKTSGTRPLCDSCLGELAILVGRRIPPV